MTDYYYRITNNKSGWQTGAFMLRAKRKQITDKYKDKISKGITDDELWEIIKKDEKKEKRKNKVRHKPKTIHL
jgi:hypothetical protein